MWGLSSFVGCATIKIRQKIDRQMNPLYALEFLAKHTVFKTVTGIAQAAGVDTSNLHACLSRKRSWPKSMVSRVACALGVEVVQLEPAVKFALAPRTVIHLAIDGGELADIAEVLGVIADRGAAWLMMVPQEEPPAGAVQVLALARVNTSYLVLHITWASTEAACEGIDELHKTLPGRWLAEIPTEGIGCNLSSPEWIRMRAGVEGIESLDRIFEVQQAPRIEEWANMLLDVSRIGVAPSELTRLAFQYSRQIQRAK